MLGIKYNNSWLDLPEKYSINLTLYNPFLRFDTIDGDFSYNFSLPNSPNNKTVLGHPDIIENRLMFDSNYDVELYLDGLFWKFALLNITQVTSKSLTVNLKAGAGEFAVKTAGKKLKDIDFGNYERIPEAYRYILAMPYSKSTPDFTDYIDVVIGAGAYHYTKSWATTLFDCCDAICKLINTDTASHKFTAYTRFYGYDSNTGGEICFLYIVAETFGDEASTALTVGYGPHFDNYATQINNLSLQVGDIIPLQTHMNNLLNEPYYKEFFKSCQYCFPTFYNKKYGTGAAQAGFAMFNEAQLINEYDGDTSKYVINYLDFPNTLAIPFPFAKYLIERILADSGFSVAGKFFLDNEMKTLCLANQMSLDGDYEEYSIGGSVYWIYGHRLNLKNHVGNGTAGDLIKDIRSTFGLVFSFNSKTKKCHINTIKSILNSLNIEDWTQKAGPFKELAYDPYDGVNMSFGFDSADSEISDSNIDLSLYTMKGAVNTVADLPVTGNSLNDIRLVLEHNFLYMPDPDLIHWHEVGEFLNDLILGNGKYQVKPGISPMAIFKDQYIISAIRKLILPVCSQPGSSAILNYFNDYALRLLFFRSIHKDGDNKDYPLASMDIYNYFNDKVGNYAIKWDGAYGLLASFWTEFINFLKGTKPITFPLNFTTEDLVNLNIVDKKRIDGNVYLIDNLELNITEKGINNINGNLYLVNMSNASVDYTVYGNEAGCFYLELVNPEVILSQFTKDDLVNWQLEIDGCCPGEMSVELNSGSLPTGLEIMFSDDGWAITGTANNTGTFTFTLRVFDECGNERFYEFTIEVIP